MAPGLTIPRRRLLALVLAVVLSAGLGVLAGPASAARRHVPPGYFGVVQDGGLLGGSVPLASQTSAMVRVGVESLGGEFNWSVVQPYASQDQVPAADRSRFRLEGGVPTDFSSTDAMVGAAARAGLRVLPVLIQAPVWARLHADRNFSPPTDPAQYGSFAATMVQRYGPSGSFWAEHPGLARLPITAWQVWNEPAGGDTDHSPSVFWQDPGPFQPRYVALLHAAHDAIKAADPHAEVVLASLIGPSWQTLQTIYDAGARPYFDTVGLHPYTGFPRNVVQIVRLVRGTMKRNGDAAKAVTINEIGWPPFDTVSVRKLGPQRAGVAQANWLRATFNGLIAARQELKIENILWFTWLGTDSSPGNAFDYTGLNHVDRSGRLHAKPALAQFAGIARRAEGRCTPHGGCH